MDAIVLVHRKVRVAKSCFQAFRSRFLLNPFQCVRQVHEYIEAASMQSGKICRPDQPIASHAFLDLLFSRAKPNSSGGARWPLSRLPRSMGMESSSLPVQAGECRTL